MKSLKILIFLGLVLVNTISRADLIANYYRSWQGFQRPDLTQEQFLSLLPTFIESGIKVYGGKILSNYIVVIPPKDKPTFLPDEFALVAVTSQDAYKTIKESPEGIQYTQSHWDLFDKNISKSTPFVNYTSEPPVSLVSGTSYDMFGKSLDWSTGYNVVFVGLKKDGLTAEQYLTHLKQHVELAKSVMGPKGLRGYIAVANDNYEVAYLNWPTKEDHDRAVQSTEGQTVFNDAGDFMNVLMYKEPKIFQQGQVVESNSIYRAY